MIIRYPKFNQRMNKNMQKPFLFTWKKQKRIYYNDSLCPLMGNKKFLLYKGQLQQIQYIEFLKEIKVLVCG